MLRSLHSNLVLFKFCRCLDVVKESVLYIPIWFYSNLFLIKSATTSIIFTFQSGSIQIIPFFTIKSNILTLHSNLVLFKCMMPFCFDIKESLYIPPLCQVLDTYFFQISNPFSTSILTATPDFSRDY